MINTSNVSVEPDQAHSVAATLSGEGSEFSVQDGGWEREAVATVDLDVVVQ